MENGKIISMMVLEKQLFKENLEKENIETETELDGSNIIFLINL